MAAIQVTTSGANIFNNSSRNTFRSKPNGIPYLVYRDYQYNEITVAVGNSNTPTAFVEYTINTETLPCAVSAAMDYNNILHITWLDIQGKASKLRYTTFDCDQNSYGTAETIIDDIGEIPALTGLYTAIAIDSNNIPHIVYTAYPKIAGAPTYTAMYTNKVTGSWKASPVTLSATKLEHCKSFDIAIDLDNKPFIGIHESSISFNILAFHGDANDANSFTSNTVNQSNFDMEISLAVDTAGDHIFAISVSNGISSLLIYRHTYESAWTFSSFERANTNNGGISILTVGLIVYVFYRDYSDSTIKYVKYENSSWDASPTLLETGTFDNIKAKWSFWFDNYSEQPTEELFHSTTPIDSGAVILSSFNSQKAAQSFDGNNERLNSVRVRLKKAGTPTGNLTVKLFSHTGTYGVDGKPLTELAAAFNSLDVSTLPTEYALYDFNFRYILGDAYYFIVVEYSGGDAANRVYMSGCEDTEGNRATYSGTWYAYAGDYYIDLFEIQLNVPELDYAFTDEETGTDIWWNTLSLISPAVTKILKYFNGSVWIEKPLKYHNGSSWVTKPLKVNL